MRTTVYRTGDRQSAREVFEVLSQAGLSPCFPFDPEKYLGLALWMRYRAEIAVPDEQVERAIQVLRSREASRPGVRPETIRYVRRQLFGGLLVFGAILMLARWISPELSNMLWGLPALAVFVVLGIRKYRHFSEILRK